MAEEEMAEEEMGEEEIEKLEKDLEEMGEKILHLRRTLPHHLNTTFLSTLAARRPPPSPLHLPQSHPNSAGKQVPPCEDDELTAEKVQLLKDRISRNLSALPVVLKRTEECISRIDKLESYSVHPVFQELRTGG